MENVNKAPERRHPIKNLPLIWSFFVYVLMCIVVAFVLSMTVALIFAHMRDDLYLNMETDSAPQFSLSEAAGQDESESDEDSITVYMASDDLKISPEDESKMMFYGWMSILCIPVISLLCILVTGILFYYRKLKTPLKLFDSASARIAAGDLDFSIAYDNRNEMGRLAQSFEMMRAGLMENNKEMWRMIEQRKQLNAAFAHDLRTPLTVLRGYTEYLGAYVPQKRVPEEKLLSTVSLMHDYVLRLEGYASSMGLLQNLEDIKPNRQLVSFETLSKRMQDAVEMLRGTQALSFDFRGEGELSADPDLIVQVLENLVANAVRFSKTKINVLLSLNNKMLTLTVSDDGAGFTEQFLAKGIAPFGNRKDEDLHSSHFGLGLYICSLLCRCHGGSLTAANEGGAKVTATFACGS